MDEKTKAVKKALLKSCDRHEECYVGMEDKWGFVKLDGDFDLNALAIAAIESYKSALAEAGYVIVPREPTEEMCDNILRSKNTPWGSPAKWWSAGVSAAPKL